LLVELGWLPFGPARALPTIEIPSGVQTLIGLLLPWPAQGLRLGENRWDEASQVQLLAYLDRKEIERATGLRLYDGVLRPDPNVDMGRAVRDAVALPNTLPPAQHRGYAVQWWALSLTTVLAFLILYGRRRAQ
jgi:cytochrome oxidase assembly protein ShyY1